jgi:hypothetical protein
MESAIKQPRKGAKGAKHEAACRKVMGMLLICRVKIRPTQVRALNP